MKKTLMVVSILLVLLVAFSVVGLAFAQTPTPQPANPFGGRGMMGGRGQRSQSGTYGTGMMGRGMMGGSGPIRVYMVQALADELGLKVEDLQARITAGETPWQILQAEGLADEQVVETMTKVHATALDAAVAAGAITQAQADWMKAQMASRMQWQLENGAGMGFGGCLGRGFRPQVSPQATQPAS